MHFWIDKRSQTCGFSGRHRIPSSLSAGSSRSQARSVANSGIWGGGSSHLRTPVQAKPMVTPVHRFQSIESVANAPSNSRPSRHSQRHHHRHHQHHGNSQLHNEHQHGNNHHHGHQYHQRTIHVSNPHTGQTSAVPHSQAQQQHGSEFDRVYLDVPNVIPETINGPQLAGPMKIKCNAMWLSFGALTLFAGGARLYLSNQVLVFAMVLVMALVITCYVGICRTGNSWEVFDAMVQPHQLPSVAVAQAASLGTTAEPTSGTRSYNITENMSPRITQEEVMLTTVFSLQSSNNNNATTIPTPQPPPPPYHIAILLPHQPITDVQEQIIDESPPPSYDKIIR